MGTEPRTDSRSVPSLARLLLTSLWLGISGFGGGFAIINLLKRKVVERERWIDEARFVEVLAIATTLPGAFATNVLTMVAHRLRGPFAAVLAIVAFLAPSGALMVAFAAGYDHFRDIAAVATCLDGMSAATVGVVAAVAVDIGRSALKGKIDWAIGAAACAAISTGALSLLEAVAITAALGASFMRPRMESGGADRFDSRLAIMLPAFGAAAVTAPALISLLGVFARIGIATFGSGFAMIGAIDHEIVATRGWLTADAFKDGVVLGLITPGPVAMTATFVGYRVAGLAGACVATAGMFGPPVAISLIAARSIDAFRSNRVLRGALRALGPAVAGIIAAAAISLARTAVHHVTGAAVAAAAFAILVAVRRVPPIAVLAAGGALAWIVRLAGAAP
jgi:chromate transporter